MMSLTGWIATGLVLALGAAAQSEPVQHAFRFPWIERFGGVVKDPHAVEPPRAGTKVAFDITSIRFSRASAGHRSSACWRRRSARCS
jgi:hypothetical protein